MRILDRYITRNLLTSYLSAILTFVFLYIIVDLFANSDEWIRAKMPLSTTGYYYLNTIPEILILIGPVALLMATLFSLGKLCNNNELTAMRASGISLYRTILPLFSLALLISLGTMLLNETVVPHASQKASEIRKKRKETRQDAFIYRDIQLYGKSGNIFYVRTFDEEKKIIQGIQILKYSLQGSLESRIDAEEARWIDERWVVFNGFIKIYDTGGNPLGEPEQLWILDIEETPKAFSSGERREKELSLQELRRHIRTLEKSGFNPRREWVEFHSKFSLPLANLIIVILGIPFALHTRRGGVVVGFGKAIGIGFLYLSLFRLGQFFGQSYLPPLAGAWSANVIFAGVGMALILRVRK